MNPRLRRDVEFASDTKINDAGCMKTLKAYANAAFLGNGKYGVALRVTHSKDEVPVVVKIMTRADADGDEARAEITKSLQVDTVLAQSNSIFSRVHGWIACGPVKMQGWVNELANAKNLDFNPRTAKCYYLVSEYGGAVAMKSLQFNLRTCKQFVFELLWTLNEAFKEHSFHHNDFHPGNIVVKTNEAETRHYGKYKISSQSRPVIIDYGMCTFGPADELKDAYAFWARYKGGTPRSDEVALRVHRELREGPVYELLTKAKKNPSRAFISGPLRDVCKLLAFLAFDPDSAQLSEVKVWAAALLDFAFTQTSIEAVVTSAYFAELLEVAHSTTKRRKANALSNCMICGQIAAQCYEHAPSYRFCSVSGCARSMGPIGFILT